MDGRLAAEIERYEAILDTCRTLGFRYIVEEATRTIFEIQTLALAAGKWDDVCVLRGRAENLAELVNLEASTEYALRALNEHNEDDE